MSRNAVDDFFVDAGAGGRGKCGAARVLMRIVLEERLGVAEAKVLGDYGVDIGRGHARGNDLAHELVRLPDTNAGLAHQGDFTFRFKLNHGERYKTDEVIELDNLIKRGNYWRMIYFFAASTASRTLAKTSSGVPSAGICCRIFRPR